MNPRDLAIFYAGAQAAIELFGIYRNGTREIGSPEIPVKDAIEKLQAGEYDDIMMPEYKILTLYGSTLVEESKIDEIKRILDTDKLNSVKILFIKNALGYSSNKEDRDKSLN